MPLKSSIPSLDIRVTHDNAEVTDGIFQQAKVSIGRSPDCDISLRDFKYVSRHHLTLFLQKNSVRVVDGNSTMGTSYLGEKISSVEIASRGVFKIHDLNVEVLFRPAKLATKIHNLNINAMELTRTANLLMQIDSDRKETKSERTPDRGSFDNKSKKSSVSSALESSHFLKTQFFGDPGHLDSPRLSLRASLVWKGQVLDSHIFDNNQHILITGNNDKEGLFVPGVNFALQSVGYVVDDEAHICVADGAGMYVSKAHTEPEFTKFKVASQKTPSGMFELDAYDRCLVLLNNRLGISYEFVDTSEQLTSTVLRKEDHDFLMTIRNVVVVTLIVAVSLIMLGDSKRKSKDVISKKERIVEVIIPSEKKPEPKPKPKLEPKPKPKLEPKPKPKLEPKPRSRPKAQAKTKTRSKKRVVRSNKPQPSLRLSKSPPRSSSPRPKVQKPTNNALAAFASFNKLNTFKPGKVGSNFKIDPNASKSKGVSQGQNLIASLNKSGQASPGLNSGKSALNQVSTDFSSKNLSDKTGKWGVKGAPVGQPKLLNSPDRTQGLGSKQVMAVVQKHLSAVQRCYERALFNQPNLSGRIEYEWTISPKGKVKSVSVRRSEASGDKALNDCVKKVFRKMKFPSATNGQSTITSIGFPFGKL